MFSWHLSFEDGLEGAGLTVMLWRFEICFSLSNSISLFELQLVVRCISNPAKGVNLNLAGFGVVIMNVSILTKATKYFKVLNAQGLSKVTSINVVIFIPGIYFVRITDNISGKSYVKRLLVKPALPYIEFKRGSVVSLFFLSVQQEFYYNEFSCSSETEMLFLLFLY
jgi:hypothetical protein